MKQCPVCKNWTLDFDSHFGRYRCLDASCSWMPASSAERELRLLRSRRGVEKIGETEIDKLGVTLSSSYDPVSDALVFDFGLDEPTFDLPEDDGIMVWSIGRRTGSVAGFCIFKARELAFREVRANIAIRKMSLEEVMKRFPKHTTSRLLVEQVHVSAKRQVVAPARVSRIQDVLDKDLAKFRKLLQRGSGSEVAVGA